MGIHIAKPYNVVVEELGLQCWHNYMDGEISLGYPSARHSGVPVVAFIYGYTEEKVRADVQRAFELLRDRFSS